MKILLVHNSGSRHLSSGEMRVVENEKRALQQRGIDVYLHVVYNDAFDSRNPFKLLKTGLNFFYSLMGRELLAKLLKQFQPDLVHFHSILPLLTPSVFHLCHQKNIPVLQTLHNFRWLCVEGGLYRDGHICRQCLNRYGWPGAWHGCAKNSRFISLLLFSINALYRRSGYLYRWVDKFIAVSEFVRDAYVQAGFPSEKIVLKYNGVTMPTQIEKPETKQGITFVGRLTKSKGTEILGQLFDRVKYPFNIIGSGPEEEKLKTICRQNNFNHVRFWGNLPSMETFEIIATSACVIIPSQCGETFSLVAGEALSQGTPIIVSAFGGPMELVEESGGGIIVDPQDINGFGDAIEKIMNSPILADRMGNAGQNFFQQNLSIKNTTDQLIKIYEQVIENKIKTD